MPAWILAALRLLGGGFAAGTGLELAQRQFGDPEDDFRFAQGDLLGGGVNQLRRLTRGGLESGRRRRRRRALTASDRADIAFIAGMISKAAAKDFAVQLAARPR